VSVTVAVLCKGTRLSGRVYLALARTRFEEWRLLVLKWKGREQLVDWLFEVERCSQGAFGVKGNYDSSYERLQMNRHCLAILRSHLHPGDRWERVPGKITHLLGHGGDLGRVEA
jgi:hypothetical protein